MWGSLLAGYKIARIGPALASSLRGVIRRDYSPVIRSDYLPAFPGIFPAPPPFLSAHNSLSLPLTGGSEKGSWRVGMQYD